MSKSTKYITQDPLTPDAFSQRVVDPWNSLPAKVIESNTVNGFKNQLNSHFSRPRNQIQARHIQTGSDKWI